MNRYLFLGILLVMSVAMSAGTANALVWSDFGAGVNPFSSGSSTTGWSTEDLFAAARLGSVQPARSGFSPWEIAVGRDRISSYQSSRVGWQNHRDYSFELAFDGSRARWSVNNGLGRLLAVDYSSLNTADLNAIAFRVATRPGSSDAITLSNLSLNGERVGAGSFSWAGGDAPYRWWGLSEAGDLSSGFTLAGNLRWDWSSPSGLTHPSGMEIEVHGANLVPATPPLTPPVPEPGTLALLGSGMLSVGAALVRRRPRR